MWGKTFKHGINTPRLYPTYTFRVDMHQWTQFNSPLLHLLHSRSSLKTNNKPAEQAAVATPFYLGNNLGTGLFQGAILLPVGQVTPEAKGRMEGYKEEKKNTHIYQMYQILEVAELKLNGSVGSEVSA